jgi:hypothetical protein
VDPEINLDKENPEQVYPITSSAEAACYKVLYAVGHMPANIASACSGDRSSCHTSLIESTD